MVDEVVAVSSMLTPELLAAPAALASASVLGCSGMVCLGLVGSDQVWHGPVWLMALTRALTETSNKKTPNHYQFRQESWFPTLMSYNIQPKLNFPALRAGRLILAYFQLDFIANQGGNHDS